MLVGYLGVPQLSLLDLRLSSENVGASVADIDTATRYVRVVHLHPTCRRLLTPIVPIRIESIDLMKRSFKTLNKSSFRFLGLLTASISELHEYSIDPYRNGNSTFTGEDLRSIINSAVPLHLALSAEPKRTSNLSEDTLREVNRDSVLQKVQSCLYRIRDHKVRSDVQTQVYKFLSGDRVRPNTGIPFMDAALQGELLDRFRKAVKSSKVKGIDEAADEFQIDRFEIAFVLAKKEAMRLSCKK